MDGELLHRAGPTMAKVTVVIVTYNSAAVLAACLDSLPSGMAEVPYQLVVVDNASTDASLDLVAKLAPTAKIVRLSDNRGYAAGINAAIQAATPSDAVLVLNPDIRLAAGSVGPLLDALARPSTGIAVPRLIDPDGRLQHSLRREPTVLRALGEAVLGGRRASRFGLLSEVIGDPVSYEQPRTSDWATGAAMLIARSCLEAVGSWDESFFLYSEETEFALRARDAGWTLRYVPEAVFVHLGGEAATSPPLWTLLTLNRVRLYRRRHGRTRAGAFLAAVTVNEALRAAAGSTVHRTALAALLRGQHRSRAAFPNGPVTGAALGARGAGSPIARPTAADGFICFSAQDWWYHNRAHSDFQLMRQVARHHPVLVINSIGMRMPRPGRSTMPLRRILRKTRSMAKLLRRPLPELPGFHVMTPLIVPFYGSPRARDLNARLVRAQVRLAARHLGIDDPAYFVTIPTAWEVVRGLPRRSLIFNRSDKHSEFSESDPVYIQSLEQALLRESDLVCYVSRSLLAEETELTGDRAVFLDHGVDPDHFRPRPAEAEPSDLRDIPRPRLGFFGSLDDYLVDFALLEQLARALPAAHLVLIGDVTATEAMDRLEALPNVHRLGFKSYEEIPCYGSGFDVGLMPWLDTEWIRHSNPIKLKEYLALGLPVVTTAFAEAWAYRDCLRIAGSRREFVELVRQTLADGGPGSAAQRRAVVAGSDWGRKADRLIELAASGQPAIL
jgi:GT2 family glycosyltransferase/glycosyltransferase involved in cell wall biosynthesis